MDLSIFGDYGKAVGFVALVVAGVWGLVEYLFWWLPERHKRLVSVGLGQMCLFALHATNWYSFGDGPAGWAAVGVLGIVVAPFAAAVHDMLITKYAPWLKNRWAKKNGNGAAAVAETPAPPAGGTE